MSKFKKKSNVSVNKDKSVENIPNINNSSSNTYRNDFYIF